VTRSTVEQDRFKIEAMKPGKTKFANRTGAPDRKRRPRLPAQALRLRRGDGSSRAPLAIVKIGGSHYSGPHIRDWLAAIAAEAGAVVIVPGGGPFADAVRSAQASMGYDDGAAHDMALAAMAQFGRALTSLNPALRLSASRSAIARALRDGEVPVWSPEPMARAAALPETWALTSDSLAAWLAGELGALNLMLVKHGHFEAAAVGVDDLVAHGVLDSLFPRFLRESGVRAWLAAPAESARLAEGLRRPIFPEIVQREETT
jgi:5-(aminomethyl)-3-furanmethanol phosphate kinase